MSLISKMLNFLRVENISKRSLIKKIKNLSENFVINFCFGNFPIKVDFYKIII